MDALKSFPPELVTQIFTEGARRYPHFASTLCRTSRWTQTLALPILYSGVVLETLTRSKKFLETLKHDMPVKIDPYIFSPKNTLRGLWMTSVSSLVVDIFRLSDHLCHLALPVDNLQWIVQGSVRTASQRRLIRPREFEVKPDLHVLVLNEGHYGGRWAFPAGVLEPETGASPFFKTVTHLQLAEPLGEEAVVDLSHWVNLSHIAIPVRPGDLEVSRRTGEGNMRPIWEMGSVTRVVFVVYTDVLSEEEQGLVMREIGEWCRGERPDHEKTSRYVVCERRSLQRDWVLEQSGGLSIWERASGFIDP